VWNLFINNNNLKKIYIYIRIPSCHHLDFYQNHLQDLFLLLPGDPGLQQLGADPLGSLVQLVSELRGLRGLSRGGLQGLHVGRVQDHLTLVLVLRFKRQLSLRNGERRVDRIIASYVIEVQRQLITGAALTYWNKLVLLK